MTGRTSSAGLDSLKQERALRFGVHELDLDPYQVVTGASIGGIAETRTTLDFCARHSIPAEVEAGVAEQVDAA